MLLIACPASKAYEAVASAKRNPIRASGTQRRRNPVATEKHPQYHPIGVEPLYEILDGHVEAREC